MQPRTLLAWVVMAGVAASTNAANVALQIGRTETYVGVPVKIAIVIENADRHQAPQFPDIAGATVRFVGGPQAFRSTSIINGRRTDRVTYTYQYVIVPQQAGEVVIPPVRVQADGKTFSTARTVIKVRKSDNDDLLFVELHADKESIFLGEPLALSLRIGLVPYRDQRFRVALDYRDMWRRVNQAHSSWGVFADAATAGQVRFISQITRRGHDGRDRSYYVYELRAEVWAKSAGTFDAGDLRVVVDYPTALDRDRSVFSFGDLSVTETRPVVVAPQTPAITVQPLPTTDRPAFFRGAVGHYSVDVQAAPTEVDTGDPITLTLKITGDGRLDLLQPPPLATLPELTADFKVPDEPLAGVVQGNAKIFTQSIRAVNDVVTEIPALPFAYFDPDARAYRIARSAPIPLTVRATTKLAPSQIVEAAGDSRPIATRLTALTDGLQYNYADPDEVLAQQGLSMSPGWAASMLACPVVYLGCVLARRRGEHLRRDVGYARRRTARRSAEACLRRAERATKSAEAAAAMNGALTGYIADRCNLPPGSLTRADVTARLREANVPADLVGIGDELLLRCETVQYAAADHDTIKDLAGQAGAWIAKLEKQRF